MLQGYVPVRRQLGSDLGGPLYSRNRIGAQLFKSESGQLARGTESAGIDVDHGRIALITMEKRVRRAGDARWIPAEGVNQVAHQGGLTCTHRPIEGDAITDPQMAGEAAG